MKPSLNVLFVCTGNICRSPTAEGVFRQLLSEQQLQSKIHVDSAGTHNYHPGEPPDRRSQQAAAKRGVDLSRQRARVVISADFKSFDYVLVMDRSNYQELLGRCPAEHQGKLYMFLEFAQGVEIQEVPDPYYGGGQGFEQVLDLVELASLGLLQHLRPEL